MCKSTFLSAVLLMGISSPVLAQMQEAEIDPVEASPGMYHVLLENEHVRVVEYQVPPGAKDDWHTHPAKVSYIVSGGVLRITTEDGQTFDVTEKAGSATWFEAVGKHRGENIGSTPVRIVFVEIKGVQSGRQDIERYRRD